jgi:predicted  nucleic acid-binding Zn-ribbon protein
MRREENTAAEPAPGKRFPSRIATLYRQRREKEERAGEIEAQLSRADDEQDMSVITYVRLTDERDSLEVQLEAIEAEILSLEPRRPPM